MKSIRFKQHLWIVALLAIDLAAAWFLTSSPGRVVQVPIVHGFDAAPIPWVVDASVPPAATRLDASAPPEEQPPTF